MRLNDLIGDRNIKGLGKEIESVYEEAYAQMHSNGVRKIIISPASFLRDVSVRFLMACGMLEGGYEERADNVRVYTLTEKGAKAVMAIHEKRLRRPKKRAG